MEINNFEYIEYDRDVELTRYHGNQETVEIPNTLQGKPVTKIGDYALHECRNITKVILPNSIVSIGSHAFFNCRKLKSFHGTDCILTVEDGAFKNCEALNELIFDVIVNKSQCMKNILLDINVEVEVTLRYMNWNQFEIAKLIFPRFLQDYEENTQARIINQVTYGAGVHYRECIHDSDVDYHRYDDLFRFVKANDLMETACRIAILRLEYPYKLIDQSKRMYLLYLQDNLPAIVKDALKKNDMNTLFVIAELEVFTKENIDSIIDMVYETQNIEGIRFLMEYKKSRFGIHKKLFEL